MSITLGTNLNSQELLEKNLQNLSINNYSIDECIEDANSWFATLAIEINMHSRGYKLACKKLADEVQYLRCLLNRKDTNEPNTKKPD